MVLCCQFVFNLSGDHQVSSLYGHKKISAENFFENWSKIDCFNPVLLLQYFVFPVNITEKMLWACKYSKINKEMYRLSNSLVHP